MAKSNWMLKSNIIGGRTMYIAVRIRNVGEVVHSGNMEHFGEYSEDLEAVRRLVNRLNREGVEE